MITPERVYEVFGITHGPWKLDQVKGYCVDNILDQSDGLICQSDVPMVAKNDNSSLIKSSPEMLVALVEICSGMESFLEFVHPEHELTIKYNKLKTIIESADSKNRPWSELLKELTE